MEPAAAALAAERATEAQIQTILAAAYAIHPEKDDMQALFDADCRFHVTLLDATQNQVMRQMRQIILTMLRVSYEFGVKRSRERPGHARGPHRRRRGDRGPQSRSCAPRHGRDAGAEPNACHDTRGRVARFGPSS